MTGCTYLFCPFPFSSSKEVSQNGAGRSSTDLGFVIWTLINSMIQVALREFSSMTKVVLFATLFYAFEAF